MHYQSLSEQITGILNAIFSGALSAVVYDCIRFLRFVFYKSERADLIFANITDIIFSFFSASLFCVVLYIANNGIFRWYLLFGMAVGFLLYRVSIGRGVYFIIKKLAGLLRIIVRRIVSVLLFPLKKLCRFVKKPVFGIYNRIKLKKENKRTEKLKKISHMGRIRKLK